MSILLTIPIPPSANLIWRTCVVRKGKRFIAQTYKSGPYKKWLVRAGRKAREQYGEDKPPIDYACNVTVHLYGGTGYSVKNDPEALVKGTAFTAGRDGDNVLKPILDCLRHENILVGDTVSHVPSGGWVWHGRRKGERARCIVEITEAKVEPTKANLFVGLEAL